MSDDKSIKKWRIGDFCRAVYSEDDVPYEAEILSIGGARCRLRYVGYGNEEDQPLARLQTSAGKKARRKQEKEAEMEGQAVEGLEEEDYGEGDAVENRNGEEEEGEDVEEEEEEPAVEKSAQRGLKKSRKPTVQQGDSNSAHNATAAGQGYSGVGQNYHTPGQQSQQAEQYPGAGFPAWGPWGASSEQYGPTSGPGGQHFGPWGPKPGPWGPPHGPWGAAPPFPGQWGPHPSSYQSPQFQQGFRGTSGADSSFHPHPVLPPPPPPPPIPGDTDPVQLANMLMSWYISGYHTGYYQARREASRAARSGRK